MKALPPSGCFTVGVKAYEDWCRERGLEPTIEGFLEWDAPVPKHELPKTKSED